MQSTKYKRGLACARCRTYKFLDTALYVQGAEFANSRNPQFMKHCYLQTDAFESGAGFYGIQEAADFSGYTSGRVAERYVKNGKLSVLPFVLSVTVRPLAQPLARSTKIKLNTIVSILLNRKLNRQSNRTLNSSPYNNDEHDIDIEKFREVAALLSI